jgi:prepilin-type N-terminal cleavage/methylation domain-containing protein
MKALNNIGLGVLAAYLIIAGLVAVFRIDFPGLVYILPLLAIIAGVLILLRVRDSKATVNLGFLLLSIWLVLTGLMPLLNINLPEMVVVMAVLGLAAGILILIGQ